METNSKVDLYNADQVLIATFSLEGKSCSDIIRTLSSYGLNPDLDDQDGFLSTAIPSPILY